MQFSIQQAALVAALAHIVGVAPRSGEHPILSNALLTLEGTKLMLATTNLELHAQTTVEVEGKMDGTTTVTATKLQALIRALPDEKVTFKSDSKDNVLVTCGKSRFKLNTLPATDFPELKNKGEDAVSTINLPGTMLVSLLDRAQRAMAHGDARFYLNGMLMELSDSKLRLVATDGHRMSLAEKDFEHDQKPCSVILPRKGVIEFMKLLKGSEDDVTLTLSRSNITLTVGSSCITSQAIEGRYPDYEAVLPKPIAAPATIDRSALGAALDRVGVTANEKYNSVLLELKSGLIVLRTDTAGNTNSGEDSFEVEFEGKPIKIGFNLQYIRDALSSISTETVEIHIKDSNSSALVVPTGDHETSRHVVMPLKT